MRKYNRFMLESPYVYQKPGKAREITQRQEKPH